MVGHLSTPILGVAGLCIKYNVHSHTCTVPLPPQQSPSSMHAASVIFHTNTKSYTNNFRISPGKLLHSPCSLYLR
jgi:hypothetical protein